MTTNFALIHSPLVGSTTWQPVSKVLEYDGCDTIVPSLATHLESGPPYYERLAAAVASAIDRSGARIPLVVVGHSGAGALIPSIIDASNVPISAAIFVAATFPHPNKCWLEIAPASRVKDLRERVSGRVLPPWNEWFSADTIATLLPNEDLRNPFVAELPTNGIFRGVCSGSAVMATCRLRLSSTQFPLYGRSGTGGTCRLAYVPLYYSADHLAMLTQPREIADLIRSMADRLICA